MKKLLLIAISLFMFSCSSDDDTPIEPTEPIDPTTELCSLSIRKIERKKNNAGTFVVTSDVTTHYDDNFAPTTPSTFFFSNGMMAGSAPKVACGYNSIVTVFNLNTQTNGSPDVRTLEVIQTTGN